MARLAFLLLLAAGAVHAEGAVRVLDCRVLHDCDVAGFCEETTGPARFRLEPQALSADGSGTFLVDAGGGPVAAQGQGDAGPWTWTGAAGDRATLVLTDETHALWAEHAADGKAHVRFLTCEVTQ